MIQPGKHIHLIGIGGTGLSAIARVLLERGVVVSGSDRQMSPLAQSLAESGATIHTGHRAEYIQGADVVVRSSAVRDDNPEVLAAQELGIPVLKRADFLGELTAGYQTIAVAGSHGKTTTTAMIAWMLAGLGLDPSYIIGGVSANLGGNAHAGRGRLFVIEADEYDWMFLGLDPQIAVITNVEYDHPDLFETPEAYRQAFLDFTKKIHPDGLLLACADDPGAAWVLEQVSSRGTAASGYGINNFRHSVYHAENLSPNEQGGFDFDLRFAPTGMEMLELPPVKVSLQVPGEHNVRNALAALAVAHHLEIPVEAAARVLQEFSGTGRRFEVLGEVGGVIVIDDYAHHPTKIRATLSAARSRYPDREIWAVWQPHTYSRTKALFAQFAGAFAAADHVIVTDVYPAREPVDPDFSSRQVVEQMQHSSAVYTGRLTHTEAYLLEHLRPGSVMIVMSAGDADQISKHVLSALEGRSRPS